MILASEMKAREGRLKLQVKTNWVRGLFVLGIGAGGAMALCLAAVNLIAKDPQDGFALLKSWGPWAIVVVVVVFAASQFATRAVDVVQVGLTAWVSTAEKGAEAQTRTADALTRLAEQGGRSAEEVRRLTMYAAQEFPSVYARFDSQDAMLKTMNETVLALHRSVGAMAAQLDVASTRAGRGEG